MGWLFVLSPIILGTAMCYTLLDVTSNDYPIITGKVIDKEEYTNNEAKSWYLHIKCDKNVYRIKVTNGDYYNAIIGNEWSGFYYNYKDEKSFTNLLTN